MNDLEELRKHEDGLISARINIFLLAHTLLITAIGLSSQDRKIKLLIVCLGILLSCFWISTGVRQWALMNWYTDKIRKDSSSIAKIHEELIEWKRKNFWYRIAGQNWRLRVLTIMCCYLPISFLVFYVLVIIFSWC